MVDVGDKVPGERRAWARAVVRFPQGVLATVLAGEGPKGAVTEIARVAGIAAAKRTADLVPLCHPLLLDWVDVEVAAQGDDALLVDCRVRCTRATGVEMEAMVGAAIAAVTLYDMTKALDPAIAVESVVLVEKEGGKRGHWTRPGGPADAREGRPTR
ncbi:MAG: cyclic pyranopterin monophosphate synthase MoaC [Planctomycetota bacterium]